MDFLNDLFKGIGYIEGITIINIEGEILFTAKFNNKLDSKVENYEVIGKKFLDVYENLNEDTSTAYLAMRKGVPVYMEEQVIVSKGREPERISSLSLPIRSGRAIVGALDLSVTLPDDRDSDAVPEAIDLMDLQDSVRTQDGLSRLQRRSDAEYTLEDIYTCDGKMLRLKNEIKRMAATDLPVLIYGETGTGKELVAQSLHNASARAGKPFIAQNCAAIPASLMESILFGTVKGAFTGSVDNVGLLEMADGGTLFLDEINSLPAELQPKLLRVIQTGKFRKLGDTEIKEVNVRFLASTNERPKALLESGRIRQDLYYRLAVLTVELPPLRERACDIPLLTNHFISQYNERYGTGVNRVSRDLYDLLQRQEWAGNVRELENVIAYGMSMLDEDETTLTARHVAARLPEAPDAVTAAAAGASFEEASLPEMVDRFEAELIRNALEESGGNIAKAAKRLKIPRQTLSRKVNDLQKE